MYRSAPPNHHRVAEAIVPVRHPPASRPPYPTMTLPNDRAVFHICSRAAAVQAQETGDYRADSLAGEGFIHLSRAHQVLPTAAAYFAGVPDLVVLVIDPTALTAPLVYEPPAPLPTASPKADAPGELYPHCYGPIDVAAIVDVIELAAFNVPSAADGVADAD
jgi:uncharacterized protein (DUF952 family)